MKALITGATGFIGSYLLEKLLNRGYEVTCLIRESSDLKWIRFLKPEILRCDLLNRKTYAEAIEKADYIFHVAGLTKGADEEEYFRANASCTKELIKASAEINTDIKRFVLVSSLAATGPSRDGKPVAEESAARPVSFYGRSKLEGEQSVLEYWDKIPITILRPAAVYGPRDTDFFLLFQAVKRGIFPYWENGLYSLIYIDDLVHGIIAAAEAKEGEGKIFFLSDPVAYSNEDIMTAISAALSVSPLRIRIPRAIMPVLAFLGQKIIKKGIINPDKIKELGYPNWTCDSGRAERELGFYPRVSIREGMKMTADWYRANKWL